MAWELHSEKFRWLHKESFRGWKIWEGVSQKLHKKKKRDTMKEEHMQKYTEGQAADDKEH